MRLLWVALGLLGLLACGPDWDKLEGPGSTAGAAGSAPASSGGSAGLRATGGTGR